MFKEKISTFAPALEQKFIPKLKDYTNQKNFKKSLKKIWIIKSKGAIFADPKRKNRSVQVLKNSG